MESHENPRKLKFPWEEALGGEVIGNLIHNT
jgi:hypothetical protein